MQVVELKVLHSLVLGDRSTILGKEAVSTANRNAGSQHHAHALAYNVIKIPSPE